MRIAIDAMGGDHAPVKILDGALEALSSLDSDDRIILVGDQEIIRHHLLGKLPQLGDPACPIQIQHASQVITMDDSPVDAIRNKRDSSIVRMVRLAKQGDVDAIISAGNTGALVAAGVLMLKPLAGVDRPGIAVMLPSTKGAVMLCDAGANIQPKPAHLYQYAVMAALYVQAMCHHRESAHPPSHASAPPTVGILNVGTENEKGTTLVKEARELIEKDPLISFVGYVEGRDISQHPCDVLITDGFTGNVTLKIIEGWSESLFAALHQEVHAEGHDLAARLKPVLARMYKRYDHEEYGGALLLGVQGLFLKVHGSAGSRAIKNAVAAAQSAGKLALNGQIEARLAPK